MLLVLLLFNLCVTDVPVCSLAAAKQAAEPHGALPSPMEPHGALPQPGWSLTDSSASVYRGHGTAPSSNTGVVTPGAEPHAGCATPSLQPPRGPRASSPGTGTSRLT